MTYAAKELLSRAPFHSVLAANAGSGSVLAVAGHAYLLSWSRLLF